MSALTHCLANGQMIGSYQVVRPLGEGAMGEVYEVIDSTLDRHAALKVVPPCLARDKRIVARFRREVRATCQARHPGVVHIFDYGVLPDLGIPYFVMEYLEGETLHTRMWRASRQPSGRLGLSCVPILRQIAVALDSVHRRGLVHRDLKPGNVMLVPDPSEPGGEHAKLLDFGIVKILQGSGPSPADSTDGTTLQGAILGTPRYMAPEQWHCGGNINGKADVYALGVIAFLGLSGKLPFLASDGPELGMMHCYMKAPSLASVAPSVPRELVELVAQMLEKDQNKRPTMLAVAQALEAFLPAGLEAQSEIGAKSGSCEMVLEAEYEPTQTVNSCELQPRPSGMELTQRLLPITQRKTDLLRPVRAAVTLATPVTMAAPRAIAAPMTLATPMTRRESPTSIVTRGPGLVRESSEAMLVGSSDSFKIDRGGGAWKPIVLSGALLVCAVYAMMGMRPSPSMQRAVTAQATAFAPTAPPSLVDAAPLLKSQPAAQPQAQPSETSLPPLEIKKLPSRLVPNASCIKNTDWSIDQQKVLLGVLSRSNTRLYPKERLVLISRADATQLKRVPKSLSHHKRANLVAELRRSSELFAATAPAYIPAQAPSFIEIRCPAKSHSSVRTSSK